MKIRVATFVAQCAALAFIAADTGALWCQVQSPDRTQCIAPAEVVGSLENCS